MPKIPALKPKQVIKILEKAGFKLELTLLEEICYNTSRRQI